MSTCPDASAPAWGLYERLMPREIEAIFARHPIAYLPWGALEYHGLHAAIGLDGLKAHSLCVALAQAAGGLVLPAVYVAANTMKRVESLRFKRHSLDFREETVRHLVREHLDQLAEEGFKLIFLLCGHVGQPHYDLIKAEATSFNETHRDVQVLATSETDLLPTDLVVVNHAALGEVSFLMQAYPEAVDLSRLPPDRIPTLEDDAVWGPDPREASPEKGRVYTDAFVRAAHGRIRAILAPRPSSV